MVFPLYMNYIYIYIYIYIYNIVKSFVTIAKSQSEGLNSYFNNLITFFNNNLRLIAISHGYKSDFVVTISLHPSIF